MLGEDLVSDSRNSHRSQVTISTGTARERLLELLQAHSADADELAEAVELMEATGSVAFASGYALALVTDAKAKLDGVLPASKAKDLLLSMADFFVARHS